MESHEILKSEGQERFGKKKEKYWHQRAYTYKKLREKLGMDWAPPSGVIEEGRGKELYKPNYPASKSEYKEALKKTVDPRTSYKV